MTKRGALAVLVGLILGGFALRLFHLASVPFRGDEAFAAQYWAGQPLSVALEKTATLEPHPILTYAIFRAWGLVVGINEFTLRLLPTLFNLMAIPAIYALGCRLNGRRLGLLAAFLWAVNPYQIWHSQDARNYAIWVGMSAVSMWLALRIIDKGRRVDGLLYVLVATITAFTFYLELFVMAAMGLFALIVRWSDRCFMRRWIGVHLLVVAAVIGSFLLLQGSLFQRGGYGGTIGSVNLAQFLPTLLFGSTLPPQLVSILWLVILLMLVAGLRQWWRHESKSGLFLALIGVVPAALLLVASFKLDVLDPRYILPVTVSFTLIFAGLVLFWSESKPIGYKVIGFVLLVGWFGLSGYGLYGHFFVNDYAKSRNWPALTRYLSENVQSDDLVIQTGVDAAFGYYYNAAALDIGLPENPQQATDEIIEILTETRAKFRSIWAVGQTFPDWPNAGIVEAWLEANMQRVRSTVIDGLPAQQFMRWEVDTYELASSPLAAFENVAELVGAKVFEIPEPTGELTIWLYWKPLVQTQSPLKVFVHLVGVNHPATGTPLWTQDDHFPQDGRVNTDTWEPNETYRDVYHLPLSAVPPGEYAIVVGLYEPSTNERILVGDSDSHLLQHFSLKK